MYRLPPPALAPADLILHYKNAEEDLSELTATRGFSRLKAAGGWDLSAPKCTLNNDPGIPFVFSFLFQDRVLNQPPAWSRCTENVARYLHTKSFHDPENTCRPPGKATRLRKHQRRA